MDEPTKHEPRTVVERPVGGAQSIALLRDALRQLNAVCRQHDYLVAPIRVLREHGYEPVAQLLEHLDGAVMAVHAFGLVERLVSLAPRCEDEGCDGLATFADASTRVEEVHFYCDAHSEYSCGAPLPFAGELAGLAEMVENERNGKDFDAISPSDET